MKTSAAFQGGGARVIELMAAAQALKKFDGPELQIARISGTSAGAIAAAMYATDCDIISIIAQHDKIKSIINRHFSSKQMSRLNIIWRLARGRSIYHESSLKTALIDLFNLGGVDAQKPVSELIRKDLQIRFVGSNIRYHNSSIADEHSSIPLWRALADSAAIPFAFRMPRRCDTPEILDGGLFQNLPGYAATYNLEFDHIPVAFSFKKEDAPNLANVSLRSYAAAIINSMLSERELESARMIKEANIIRLPSKRTTFDFESITRAPLYDDFGRSVSEIETKISEWIAKTNKLPGYDITSDHPTDLKEHIRSGDEAIMRFIDLPHRGGYHAEEIQTEVVYNSHDLDEPDLCMMHVKLSGDRNEGLQYLRFWFYDTPDRPSRRPTVEVTDSFTGELLPSLSLPVRNTGRVGARSIILILDKPMTKGQRLTITKSELSFESMGDYRRKGRDYQTLGLLPGRSAEKLRLTVHFPQGLRPALFRNASLDVPADVADYKDDRGIQVLGEFGTSSADRRGCFTVHATASLPTTETQRRYIKVVYHRE